MEDDGWKLVKYPHYLLLSGGNLETSEDVIAKANEMLGYKFGDNVAVEKYKTDSRAYYVVYDYQAPSNMMRLDEWAASDDSSVYYRTSDNDFVISKLLKKINNHKYLKLLGKGWILLLTIPPLLLLMFIHGEANFFIPFFDIITVLPLCGILADYINTNIKNLYDKINDFLCIPTIKTRNGKKYESRVYVIRDTGEAFPYAEKRFIKKLIRKAGRKYPNIKIDYQLLSDSIIITATDYSKETDKNYNHDVDEVINYYSRNDFRENIKLKNINKINEAEMVIGDNKQITNYDRITALQKSIRELEESCLASNTISTSVDTQINNFKKLDSVGDTKPIDYAQLVDKLENIKSTLESIKDTGANLDAAQQDLNDLIRIKNK